MGKEVARLAGSSGPRVRTLARTAGDIRADATDALAILGACDGIDAVISCLGASVSPSAKEKRSFLAVDTVANRNLIAEAKRAGVRKFVYVAAHVSPGYADSAYIRAHEAVVAELAASGLDYTVIRPTGIFSAFGDFVKMARMGMAMVVGDGSARTNPVHPADVAQACLDGLTPGSREVGAGGPDILTRREVVETAFRVVGKTPRIAAVPAAMFRGSARLAGLFNPRLGELFEFVTAVSLTDGIAPAAGTKRLEDYFRELHRKTA